MWRGFNCVIGILVGLGIALGASLSVGIPSVHAQTCGGSASCFVDTYEQGFYLDAFNNLCSYCAPTGGYYASACHFHNGQGGGAASCFACVPAQQGCNPDYSVTPPGDPLCAEGINIVTLPQSSYPCGSTDVQKCDSGCNYVSACTGGTVCGSCNGLSEPYNHCGTAFGSQTCHKTTPSGCDQTNTYFSQSCSDAYDNCDGGLGYACGTGSVCRKSLGGKVTDAETGAGIPGVTITTNAGNDMTDANGNWSVGGFGYQGSFTITPAGSGAPCTNGYVCGGISPTSPNPGSRTGTVGGAGDCGTNCNFTYTPGHVSGHVYIDHNHDGVKNGSDQGIANVTVSATNPARSDTTDGSGAYDISYLNDGAHTVSITVPAGYAGVVTSQSVTIGPNNTTTNFLVTPLYEISGTIFNDVNLDKSYEAGTDSLYTGSVTVHVSGGPTTISDMTQTSGVYDTPQIAESGNYTVSISSSIPTGWRATTPLSWQVTVGDRSSSGPVCSSGASPDAFCTDPQNGSVRNLNFGLTNETAWPQPICGDAREDAGYSEQIPATASCNGTAAPYAIMQNSNICPNIPGLLFSGGVSPSYGGGSGASTTGQQVGNFLFPELYNFSLPHTSQTSYSFVSTTITNNALTTPASLTSICPNLMNCVLSEGTPGGIYTTTAADGPVLLSVSNGDGSFNLGAHNYIFLIGDDLTLASNVTEPVGSTATFITAGDIHVASTVGESTWTSTTPDLEGVFSADANFDIDTATSGNNLCLANGQPIDKKLNIQGSVITNAAGNGGSIVNNREGCVQDLSCPVFTVTANPILLLNLAGNVGNGYSTLTNPNGILKTPYSFWQELNP